MNVQEIVTQWLMGNGYDGLYSPGGDCACVIGDLCPCSGPCMDCKPGMRTPCTCGDHDYHIEARERGARATGDSDA